MADIVLNANDVKVLLAALDTYVSALQRSPLGPDARSIDRAERLARCMRRYEVTEEVNQDEPETQHEAPAQPVVVQGEGEAGRSVAPERPDPERREASDSKPVDPVTKLQDVLRKLVKP